MFDNSAVRQLAEASDPNNFFAGKTYEDIGKDENLTRYMTKQFDPDGTKYNGDVEKLKTDFLNQYTRKGNSIVGLVADYVKSGNESADKKQMENLAARLYESAPNRLLSSKHGDAAQAMKAGVTGALYGENGEDLLLNIALAPLSAGKLTAQGVGQAAIHGAQALGLTGKEAAKYMGKEAFIGMAKQGAVREGGINAVLGGVAGAAEQEALQNRGIGEGATLAGVAGQAAIGGVFGAGMGAGFGALQSRGLTRELTGEVAPATMRDLPEGSRSLPDAQAFAKKQADAAAAEASAVPPPVDPTIAVNGKVAGNAVNYASDLRMFANEERATLKPQSKYQPDTLDRVSDVLGQYTDPERLIEISNKARDSALAAGDAELAGQHAVRSNVFERLRQTLNDAEPNEGGRFARAGQDIDESVLSAMTLLDSDLAELVKRDRLGTVPGTNKPAEGSTVATPASPAPAPSGAAAPASAGPIASTEANVPTVSGQTDSVGQTAADVAKTLTGTEQAAYNTLADVAAKSNVSIDDVINSLEKGGSSSQIIGELAKAAGVSRRVVKESMNTVTAGVVKARQRVETPDAPNAQVSDEVAPTAAKQADEPANAEGVSAGEATAAADEVASPVSAASATVDAVQNAPLSLDLLFTSAEKASESLVTAARSTLDGLLAKLPDAAGADKFLVAARAASEDGLWRGITADMLTSEKGVAKAKRKLARNASDNVSMIFADAVGQLLPNPLVADDFSRVMSMIPGIPESRRKIIESDYKKMIKVAMADEVGRLGSIDDVRRIHGSVVDAALGGPVAKHTKFPINDVVESVVDLSVLSPKQAGQVKKIVRDFRDQLNGTKMGGDSEAMESALRRRALRAIDEIVNQEWKTNNPDVLRRMESLRAFNDRKEARGGFDILWTGGLDGAQGSFIENPIVQRMRPGDADSRLGSFVTGATKFGKTQGALSSTNGMGYFGKLWSNPTRAFATTKNILREIGQAAIDAASATAKEKKGAFWETIALKVEAARFDALLSLTAKREAGELTQEKFSQLTGLIGSNSRKVTDEEIAAAMDFYHVERQRTLASEAAQGRTKDALEEFSRSGVDQTKVLSAITQALETTMAKLDGRMYDAYTKLVPQGKKQLNKGRAKAEKANDAVSLPEDKGSRIALRDEDTGKVVEFDADKHIVLRVADEDKGVGTVLLFGKQIGTFKMQSTGHATVIIGSDGRQAPFENIRTGIDLAKRQRFIGKHKADILAKSDEMVKADGKVAEVAADADVIPQGFTRSETVEKALEQINGKKLEGDALNERFDALNKASDRKWAILDRSNGTIYRVKEGQHTIADVVGKRLDTGDFVLGTLPWSRVAKNGKKLDPFNDADFAKSNFVVHGRETPAPSEEIRALMKLDEANKDILPEIVKARNAPATMKLLDSIPSSQKGFSMAQLATNFENYTKGLDFGKHIPTKEQFDTWVSRLEAMAMEIEGVAPHGIVKDNASRRTSFHFLKKMMAERPRDELRVALDMLRRIDTAGHQLPYFNASTTNGHSHSTDVLWQKASVDAKGNSFGDNGISLNGKSNLNMAAPMHVGVIHETGHWAFHNMLSPTEKVDFIRSLEKFYDAEGKLDFNAVQKTIPYAREIANALGKTGLKGETGTNELFAWQFTSYVLQTLRGGKLDAEAGIWQKVARYVKNIFSSMLEGKIDPDLLPLFERIMPSSPVEARYRTDVLRDKISGELVGVEGATTDRHARAALSLDLIKRLETHRIALDEHLHSAGIDDAGMAEDMKRAGSHMFGMLFGKNQTKTIGRIRNSVLGKGNPEAESNRAMFGRAGLGDIIGIYNKVRQASIDAADDSGSMRAWDDFVGDLDAGEPRAVILASKMDEPEFHAEYKQLVENTFAAAKKLGASDDDALDTALRTADAQMLPAALEQVGGEGYRLTDADTRTAMEDVASALRDIIADAQDSAAAVIGKEGFTTVRDQRYQAASRLEPETKAAIVEQVKKATKEVKAEEAKSRTYHDIVADAQGQANKAVIGLSPKEANDAAASAVEPMLKEALDRISKYEVMRSKSTSLKGITNVDELRAEMRNALVDGDYDTFMEAAWRIKDASKAEPISVAPSNTDVAMAVDQESADIVGTSRGIPAKAHPVLKSVVSRVTHRDGEQQTIAQSLAYRLFTLMKTNEPTTNDVARLAGVASNDVDGDALVAGGAAFGEFRKQLRSISESFTNPNRSPLTGVESLVDLVGRATDSSSEAVALAKVRVQAMRKNAKLNDSDRALLKSARIDNELSTQADDLLEKAGYLAAGNVHNNPSAVMRVSAYSDAIQSRLDKPAFKQGDGYAPIGLKQSMEDTISRLSNDEVAAALSAIGVRGTQPEKLKAALWFAQPGINGKKLVRSPELTGISGRATQLAAKLDEAAVKQAQVLEAELQRIDDGLLDVSLPAAVRSRMFTQRAGVIRTMENQLGRSLDDTASPVFVSPLKLLSADSSRTAGATLMARLGSMDPDKFNIGSITPMGVYTEMVSIHGEAKVHTALGELGFVGVADGQSATVFKQHLAKRAEEVIPTSRTVEQLDVPLNGEMFMAVAAAETNHYPIASSLGVQQRALQSGWSEPMARIASKLIPGAKKDLDGNDIKALQSHGGIQISENSKRARKMGANWLADLIKPVEGSSFRDVRDAQLGKELVPIVRLIDEIAGNDGFFKNAGSHIHRNLRSAFGKTPQSDAETRIARALHDGNAAIAKLSTPERKAAVRIAQYFRDSLNRQRAAGIPVGDVTGNGIDNFIPQRLNRDWMGANADEAIKRWTNYFHEVGGGTREEAGARAAKMVRRAVDDFEDAGILTPGATTYQNAFGEKLYARVLKITSADKEKYGLTDMFDQNLKSLLIGYAQTAVTREHMTKRFGLKGHGFKTYMEIASGGREAAANALLKKETGVPAAMYQDVPNVKVTTEAPDLFRAVMDNEEEAVQFVDSISAMLENSKSPEADKHAAVDALVTMYEGKSLPGVDHFRLHAEAIINGLSDFGSQGSRLARDELVWMDNMVQSMAGRPAYMSTISKKLKGFAGGINTFNGISLLSMATLTSLPDLGMALVRSGDVASHAKAMAESAKMALGYDSATRKAVRELGVGIESILNENISDAKGGSAGGLSNAFFWANGLTPWTTALREVSALTGFYSMKAQQEIAKREKLAGNTGDRKYLKAVRYLRQLGAAHLVDEPSLTSLGAHMEDDKLRAAIHRFTNESVFQPDRNDMPLWGQDPIGKLVMQFKSYPLMLGRMSKRSITEAFAKENGVYVGDPKPLMYLATVGAGLGMGAAALKDVVQGRNQEASETASGDWHSVRDRTMSKVLQGLGMKDYEMDDDKKDAFLGWYVQGVLSLGALGMVGDMLYNTAESLDNGAFGFQKVASTIFGPSVGTFADMFSVVGGAQQAALNTINDDEDNNGKPRAAVRELTQRVPFIGTQQAATESIVDTLAGEAAMKRAK